MTIKTEPSRTPYISYPIINGYNYDLIFAVSDDSTDEDMFKSLMANNNAFTIKVGPEASYAQFTFHTPQMVVSLNRMNYFGQCLLQQLMLKRL